MSETYTAYGIGPDKYADELQTLRDERDRLKLALEAFCSAVEYTASRMAYQCGLGAGEWEAFIDQTNYYKQYKQAKAALTPAGGASQRWTRSKPTEPGWYWYRDLSRPYEDEREPFVVKVRQYANHLAVGNCRLEGAPYGSGEWQGPLTPNEAT